MSRRKIKRVEIPNRPVIPGSPLYRLLELCADVIVQRLHGSGQSSHRHSRARRKGAK